MYGGKIIAAGVDQSVIDVSPGGRKAFSLARAFLDPSSITIETEGRWYTPSWAFLVLPLALSRLRSHRRAVGVAVVVQDTLEGWSARRRPGLTFVALLATVLLTITALPDRLGNPPELLKYALGMNRALEVYRMHPDLSLRMVAKPSDAVLRPPHSLR